MTAVRKILFITLSNIGDVILTTPVLSVLRGNFPAAEITVMVGPRAFEIFRGSKTADEVIIYDKQISLRDKWILSRELAGKDYDLVVDLRNTVFPLLIGPRFRTSVIRHTLKNILSKREQHLAALRPLIKKLKLDLERRAGFDFFSEQELAGVKKKLSGKGIPHSGLALIAAGANSHIKRWHAEGFAAVADRLASEQRKQVLFVGAPGDAPVVDEILKRSRGKAVDFCGETSLRELAALMSLSDLLVANDSSPMQMGYELGIPVVAVFGPTDEKKFGRENALNTVVRETLPCTPCESAQCLIPETKACLLRIEPERVYQACLKVIRKEARSHASSV